LSDIFIALLLGIIQGLTEFLPVSSSGHLAILQGFIGEKWLGDVLFNVSVHLGTTLAVVVFFYKDLFALLKGIMPGTYQRQQILIVACIFITTAITGIIGVLFQDKFESMFSMPRLAAGMLIITGFLTFFTDRIRKHERTYGQIRIRDAATIGLFQSLAIIPGISRSGATIFAGVFCGMERTWAASYSFIAAIPAIIGAAVLEWGGKPQTLAPVHIVGAITAFIVGLISLKFLVWTLKKHNFFIFSVYCWLAGLIYIVFSF
jgi:undecaprenyl-diphosphatase